MAEQRAVGYFRLTPAADRTAITILLTSVAWREAWKYQSRAYRYCLHDIGHAWQSVALAAQAMGCDSFAIAEFPDDDVASLCGLESDEWPMLIVELSGRPIPTHRNCQNDVVWFGGRANKLSIRTVEYPLIDQMHAATRRTKARKLQTRPERAFGPTSHGQAFTDGPRLWNGGAYPPFRSELPRWRIEHVF